MENRPFMRCWLKIHYLLQGLGQIELGTFAASSAFFLFLSLIPILMLLCSLIPYTGISEAQLLELVRESIGDIMPPVISDMIQNTIESIFMGGALSLSLSALATLWTASKAFLALIRGMDVIHGTGRQGYLVARIKACFYTFVLVVVIAFMLVGVVFGKQLAIYFGVFTNPFLAPLIWLLRQRFWLAGIILAGVFTVIYTYVPKKRLRPGSQIPGAVCASAAWIGFSALFSVYLNHSASFGIYGSLTTIIIALLWMYYCMYILLLGSYLNTKI